MQGPALRAFEGIKKRLDDTKGAIRDMNKETRNLVAEEQAINKAIAQTGQATAEQTAALAKNSARRAGECTASGIRLVCLLQWLAFTAHQRQRHQLQRLHHRRVGDHMIAVH